MLISLIVDSVDRLGRRFTDSGNRLMDLLSHVRLRDFSPLWGCQTFRSEEKEEVDMKKHLEGTELSQKIMLDKLTEYMKKKKCSDELINGLSDARSSIRKTFKKLDILSDYDLVFKLTPKVINESFGDYGKILVNYRKQLIKDLFAHRTDIPTDD